MNWRPSPTLARDPRRRSRPHPITAKRTSLSRSLASYPRITGRNQVGTGGHRRGGVRGQSRSESGCRRSEQRVLEQPGGPAFVAEEVSNRASEISGTLGGPRASFVPVLSRPPSVPGCAAGVIPPDPASSPGPVFNRRPCRRDLPRHGGAGSRSRRRFEPGSPAHKVDRPLAQAARMRPNIVARTTASWRVQDVAVGPSAGPNRAAPTCIRSPTSICTWIPTSLLSGRFRSWVDGSCRELCRLVLSGAGEQFVKVLSGELPFERLRDLLIASGERVEALLDGVKIGEVVRGENFALHDGEVDLRLV